MVKAVLKKRTPADPTVIIFGITDVNIKNLQADHPMKVCLKEMLPDVDINIFIIYGKTEEELKGIFTREGFITKDTDVRDKRNEAN